MCAKGFSDFSLKKAILELKSLTDNFKEFERTYNKKRKELQGRIFDGMNGSAAVISDKGVSFKAVKVAPKKVIFDADALEKRLSGSLRKTLIRKKYSVTDWDGFVQYMKLIGADPKMVLSFFEVEKKVDEDMADVLCESGELDPEILDGCYTVKLSDPYIRIMETEESEDGKS